MKYYFIFLNFIIESKPTFQRLKFIFSKIDDLGILGAGGYIDKKPGFCPPAKEYGLDDYGGTSSLQDLYFGLRHHHDKKHVAGKSRNSK